jgi:hypothetical protein
VKRPPPILTSSSDPIKMAASIHRKLLGILEVAR